MTRVRKVRSKTGRTKGSDDKNKKIKRKNID